jgi:uncharacterized protein YjbI with pentapeptide repeats
MQFMPGMQAKTLDINQRCIVYQVETGTNLTFVIQLATLEYLSLADTGFIALCSQVSEASHFQIATSSNGQQTWQVWDGSQSPQFHPVGYAPVGQVIPSYLLTADSCSTFASTQTTPSVTAIAQSKNGKGMDFINVDLSGQDVSGVDFTGANFTGANLTGTIFKGATLTNATFIGATLDGTSFDGATLDGAIFTGANTVLATVNWGQPKSAQNINFSGCDGRRTKLVGKSGNLIPCNSANFKNANFSGATLSYLTLDDANLAGTIATATNLTGSSLQRVPAHGANFCGAILDSTNLTNGQFGAKALLFALATNGTNDITELNNSNGKVVPSDIATACKAQPNDIDVSNGIVTVLVSGQSWLISIGSTAYNLRLSADGSQLFVYLYGGATTATLAGASLSNSTGTGANFSSVDLSNSLWFGAKADHTDLESTNLADSFLVQADFTQANVSNTVFSNAVLIQTKFKGVQLTNPGFANAQLQGVDFTNANLINGNLYQAAISLPNGVPLFVMNTSYISDLNSGNLTAIAPVFTSQGYPLGSSASFSTNAGQVWLIDNSANPTPPCIKTFAIDQSLNVSDASNPNTILFTLPTAYQSYLAQAHPTRPLITYFQNQSYPLSALATISPNVTTWQITNSADAPVNLPVVYELIAIVSEPDGFLHVYGSTLLWLKNAAADSSDIAFGSTQGIQTAINSQTICPNGQPMSEFSANLYTWEQMMTCPKPVPPS